MAIGTVVAANLIVGAASAGYNIYQQHEAAKMNEQAIRQQQVTLRIQEAEQAIENINQVERVLARQEVMAGVRNIGADSGSFAALTNETFTEFDRVNDINKLNFDAKRQELRNKSAANKQQEQTAMVNAGLNFAASAADTGMRYKSLLDMQSFNSRSVTPQGAF